jgi:DNA-binding LytR/AlgR family response regulator
MIKCIAVDDEPLALRQIASYIEKTPFLELHGKFENGYQVIDFLSSNEIDLLFVDIQMPDLNGLELVQSLNNPPAIIFTTAFSEFAYDGFKVNAVDYLLKPISYSQFLRAATKANNLIKEVISQGHDQQQEDFLFVKSDYKIMKVRFKDIRYIESMREYVKIHLINDEPIMSLMRLKNIEKALPSDDFMRVHRSYIVNLSHIDMIERNRIVFDQKIYLPVSENYQKEFHAFIKNRFLE